MTIVTRDARLPSEANDPRAGVADGTTSDRCAPVGSPRTRERPDLLRALVASQHPSEAVNPKTRGTSPRDGRDRGACFRCVDASLGGSARCDLAWLGEGADFPPWARR
jgi:hypothetical protein